jgi:hypothetical protein
MRFLINENQFTTLKNHLKEQPDSHMPFQIEKFGYKQGRPETVRQAVRTQIEDVNNVTNFIYKHRHGLLDIAALGVMFIPIIGPLVALSLSTGIEVANAALYASEGQNYDAGFALAFSLIPLGELVGKIPGVKKLGVDGLKKLMNKITTKNTRNLTKSELETISQINNNSKWVKIRATQEVVILGLKSLYKKLPLKKFVEFIYNLYKRMGLLGRLLKFTVKIGGVWYTYDKLAQYYGLTNSPIKNKVDLKKLESQYDPNNEEMMNLLISQMKGDLTDEQINQSVLDAMGEEIKFNK